MFEFMRKPYIVVYFKWGDLDVQQLEEKLAKKYSKINQESSSKNESRKSSNSEMFEFF